MLPIVQRVLLAEQNHKVLRWLAFGLGRAGVESSLIYLQSRLTLDVYAYPDVNDWFTIAIEQIRRRSDFSDVARKLKSCDAIVQREAAVVAWAHPDRPEILEPFLRNGFENGSAPVRRWSVLAMANRTSFRDCAPILAGLTDSDYLVREWTAWGLAKSGDPQHFGRLSLLLDDPHPRVREWALKAIGRLDLPESPRVLISHYAGEGDIDCREGIIRHLHASGESAREVQQFLAASIERESDLRLKLALVETLAAGIGQMDATILDALWQLAGSQQVLRESLLETMLRHCSAEDLSIVDRIVGSQFVRLLVRLHLDQSPAVTVSGISDFSAEPASAGHPAFRIESSRQSTMNPPKMQRPVEVLWLCALKEEYDQVLNAGGLRWQQRTTADGWICSETELDTVNGSRLALRLTWAGWMGREQAQSVASRFINFWQPRAIVMSGVCAGRRGKVSLGDVILADRLWSYDAGKHVAEGEATHFTGDMLQFRPAFSWLQHMQALNIADNANWLGGRPALTLEYQEEWILLRLLNRGTLEEDQEFSRSLSRLASGCPTTSPAALASR